MEKKSQDIVYLVPNGGSEIEAIKCRSGMEGRTLERHFGTYDLKAVNFYEDADPLSPAEKDRMKWSISTDGGASASWELFSFNEAEFAQLRSDIKVIDYTDPKVEQTTNLFRASSMGDHEATRKAIEAGADVAGVDGCNRTPLHVARDAGSVKALLDAGADIEAKDRWGDTPRDAAIGDYRYDAAGELERQENSREIEATIDAAMPGDMSAEMANYGKPEHNQSLTQLRPGELFELGEQAGGKRLSLDSPEIL